MEIPFSGIHFEVIIQLEIILVFLVYFPTLFAILFSSLPQNH